MKKCYIQNLGLLVTNKCNLDCAHCLMGPKNNICMSDEIIETVLDQVYIGNLAISGGEATLAIDRIEKIINYIIENHILVESLTMTINGTIYSEELLKLLAEIDNYMGHDYVSAILSISLDKYHLDEIQKLGLMREFSENLKKYRKSKYFYDYRIINFKLFREGNASKLRRKLTVPLRPMKTFITYIDNNMNFDKENGLCNIGPLITVNPEGIITECNASITNQHTVYNYGNVLNDSIENIALKYGTLVLKPQKMDKLVDKTMKKFHTYKR